MQIIQIVKNKKGFSLAEVLVSISIMGLISLVVIFNYSSFNDRVSLSSAQQEVAVAVREAQTYGLSVKEADIGSGGFNFAYGIHFDPSKPKGYLVFVDRDGSNTYDDSGAVCGNPSTECIEKFTLKNGVEIVNTNNNYDGICDAVNCGKDIQGGVRTMDIIFRRPSPNALIYFINAAGHVAVGPSSRARVILVSSKGTRKTITIESTGHVLVN